MCFHLFCHLYLHWFQRCFCPVVTLVCYLLYSTVLCFILIRLSIYTLLFLCCIVKSYLMVIVRYLSVVSPSEMFSILNCTSGFSFFLASPTCVLTFILYHDDYFCIALNQKVYAIISHLHQPTCYKLILILYIKILQPTFDIVKYC